MLCLGDIKELDDLDMSPYALRVVKHDYRPTATTRMDGRTQTVYPRKNGAVTLTRQPRAEARSCGGLR
jgi:hypothetical protein